MRIMNGKKKISKELTLELLKCVYIALSFFMLDAMLRYFTRWLGYYSIFELPPSLFSLCWIFIFITALSLMPHKVGRIVYVIWYGAWAIYSVAQYIYYLIFDKFFFLSDIQYASEGGAYLSFVADVFNADVCIMLGLFVVLGIAGFFLFPGFQKIGNRIARNVLRTGLIVSACIGMVSIPALYTINNEALFFSSKYEYEQFTNSGFDMEIAGLYQYVARDTWCTYLEPKEDPEILYAQVEEYLQAKAPHEVNAMTGILKGKNVILVQMETMDDWIINYENTPTIALLMKNGINFTNMYTSLYGSGWTFSTEYAFNTGLYQSTQGIAGYSMSKNSYPYSVANVLNAQGYLCNSFHENSANFYGRNSMHPAMGYEKYVCTADPVRKEGNMPEVDSTLITNDICWEMMTSKQPFLSFVITYSAHVPFDAADSLVQYALGKYPEYNVDGRNPELNALYAKARLTDDMFTALLERLEKDGLLESTVIIAYADHYCYGLSDKEIVHQLSEANGSSILERTPAFIWYEGCQSMTVDKVCQTVDWVPTIANLFGEDVTPYVMGSDIFDDAYEGYAIFPDGTWLTNEAYVVNGIARWNNGMSDAEIVDMNQFVQTFYTANEAILASNYYAQFED